MLKAELERSQSGVSRVLQQKLASQSLNVAQAMTYALIGGKGLRGFLVCESTKLFGDLDASHTAAAIEALHAYSLVHDDLPAMDNDDLRRGRPTVHIKWDEATAILAGDALQALAFELLCEQEAADAAKLELVRSLAFSAGISGMVGGQAMDIAAESAHSPLSLGEITVLQAGKTGALMTWSAVAGALLYQQDTHALKTYGDAIGLAFQITDDLLDVEGDVQAVGKAVGKDDAAGKATFVSHLGVDGAKRRAKNLIEEACESLTIYGTKAKYLHALAHYIIERDH